eukprot:CAMPEP_0176360834 /NCGR_PEP_ID=MMETSP0126-20121128/17337_1 /TAXON_ID=141414 ORGANISM="Strombidinopsis acuminatum, Strain SPMC142" /NCGR_SAMPLE_ID=MMETSP0126 /ASSEMBLY_ACC=CAM_ASM_000229 /LENGTH=44 /DNA_ID= /DNA_START= /DNA_END= /DNA_ORIENTATION=
MMQSLVEEDDDPEDEEVNVLSESFGGNLSVCMKAKVQAPKQMYS